MKSLFQVRCSLSLFFTLISIAVRVKGLRYLSGDFLTNPKAKSANGEYYPKSEVDYYISKELPKSRRGRSMQFLEDPFVTRKRLLEWHEFNNLGIRSGKSFEGRGLLSPTSSNSVVRDNVEAQFKTRLGNSSDFSSSPSVKSPTCGNSDTPQRFCKTKFNTTAPMYGVSLTSGKPVTIVQKFPDLLQQVIFEICATDSCDVVHGDCVQTYTPYLFLVIPLGPVTLTGQDYVLVESGCTCRPKYAGSKAPPNPMDAIEMVDNSE